MANGYLGISNSMLGKRPAFALPQNYGFDDLANYEQQLREGFGQDYNNQILDFRKQYTTDAAKRRANLATSLSDSGQKFFMQNNPAILEDLNSRGIFTSPSAVSNAQAQALKEIELGNQDKINAFDTQTYTDENQLRLAGLTGDLQAQQDAMDAGLDLRRTSLEKNMQDAQAGREEALARDLARQQSRNSLYGSLIGAGGSLGGAYLGAKALGGAGMLGGGTAATGSIGAAGATGTAGSTTAGAAGLGGFGGGAAIGASGIGAMLLARAAEKKVGAKLGTTAGNIAGTIANPIGQQLNVAKKLVQNPGKTISNAASGIGKSISKLCFDAHTPITMDDGSQVPICQLHLGSETKGGVVESIRTSRTADGTRCLYKGVRVTESHAVKENGEWVRVGDSPNAGRLKGDGVVWSISTNKHRIYVNGIEFADDLETDNYEDLTIEQSLDALNQEEKAMVA